MTKKKPAPALVRQSPIVVSASSTFDPAVLRALTLRFAAETTFVRGETIDNDDDEGSAAARLVKVKTVAKKIEAVKKELSRPHLDALQNLRGLITPYENVVAGLLGAYTRLLGAYAIAKAERLQAATEIAKEAAAERDHETVTEALNVAQENEQSKLAGISIKVKWIVSRVVMDLLPDEYQVKVADYAKLKALADATAEHDEPPVIPGVVWARDTAQRVTGA